MSDANGVTAAVAAGVAMADAPIMIEGVPHLIVPEGYQAENFARLMPAPLRPDTTVKLDDTASFIAFVQQHRTEATTLYLNQAASTFTAIFDDHRPGAPGWREFRAAFAPKLAPNWSAWAACSGREMSQERFAEFVEDNLPDIVDPPAADMLTVSRELIAKKKVHFAQGIRLANGQTELTYREEISGQTKGGKMAIPEIFYLGMSVYAGEPPHKVGARLRYRITESGLTMKFLLIRTDDIIQDALAAIEARITEALGPVLHGQP